MYYREKPLRLRRPCRRSVSTRNVCKMFERKCCSKPNCLRIVFICGHWY